MRRRRAQTAALVYRALVQGFRAELQRTAGRDVTVAELRRLAGEAAAQARRIHSATSEQAQRPGRTARVMLAERLRGRFMARLHALRLQAAERVRFVGRPAEQSCAICRALMEGERTLAEALRIGHPHPFCSHVWEAVN